jgi:hypothetical protein
MIVMTTPHRTSRHGWVAATAALAILASACSSAPALVDTGSTLSPDQPDPRSTEPADSDAGADAVSSVGEELDESVRQALASIVEVEDVDPRLLHGDDAALRLQLEDDLGPDARIQVATVHPDRLTEDARAMVAAALGDDVARILTAGRQPVVLDPITLFDSAEDADAVFARYGLSSAPDPVPPRVDGGRRGGDGDFLVVPEESSRESSLSGGTRSGSTSGTSTSGPTSFGASSGSTAGSPSDSDRFSGGDARAVARYVAHDGLPLYATASFAAEEVHTFERGEGVHVFDDLPTIVGDNVFVRVQAVDSYPFPVGWMPLFWLYQAPVGGTTDDLTFTSTYGLIADAISDGIEQIFYRGCDQYPLVAHSPMFPGATRCRRSTGTRWTSRRATTAGEYPVGMTGEAWIPGVGMVNGKWLPPRTLDVPGTVQYLPWKKGDPYGIIAAIHEYYRPLEWAPEPLTVHARLSRLDGQRRGDPYDMRDLGTAHGATQPKVRSNQLYVPKATPATAAHDGVVYDLDELAESAVRIHGTDTWFNVSLDAPAGVTEPADAYLTICQRLPGGHVQTERVYANIGLYTNLVKERHSRITAIELGGMEFSAMTACATATINPPRGSFSSGGGLGHATDMLGDTPPAAVIRFVRGTIEGLSLRHTGELKVYGQLDSVHDWLIGILLGQVNAILDHGPDGVGLWRFIAGLPIPKVDIPHPDDIDAAIQAGFGKVTTSLEQMLLTELQEVGRQLTRRLVDPHEAIRTACDTLMPSSYANVSSRYHVLYLQCLEATQDADIDVVANTGSTTCHDPRAFARVSDGTGWRHAGDRTRLLYAGLEDGDQHYSHVLRRPPWASWGADIQGRPVPGCGVRSALTTTVMSEYWPLLRCMEPTVNEGVNHRWTVSTMRNRLRSDCEVPAVKILCDMYGEGRDLREMWEQRYGHVPPTGPYMGYCSLYRDLTTEPGSQFTS